MVKKLKGKDGFACMRQLADVGIGGLLVGLAQEASWVGRVFQLL